MGGLHLSYLKTPDMKIVDFANRVDPDAAAHGEPPHPDIHYLHARH